MPKTLETTRRLDSAKDPSVSATEFGRLCVKLKVYTLEIARASD